MSELSIRLYTDPILHQPCTPVTEFNEELLRTLSNMLICMHKNKGVGLAANQVGINKQFCVVLLQNSLKPIALINPKILKASKKKTRLIEGCLSCPGVQLPMKRADEIEVEYNDLSGQTKKMIFTGFDARIVQHELDHLQGKMIIDKGLSTLNGGR